MRFAPWMALLVFSLVFAGCGGGGEQAGQADEAEQTRQAGEPEAQMAQNETVRIDIHGMHCNGCVQAIDTALAGMEGVVQDSVSLDDSLATVTFDPAKVAPEAMVAAIEKLGYTAKVAGAAE